MTQKNDHSEVKLGFLGRGPLFWLIMTAVTTATVAGLALSEAIEGSTALIAMFTAPIASMIAMFLAYLNANAAQTTTCVGKGDAQRRYIKRVALFTSLYLASFAGLTFLDQLGETPLAVRYVVAVLPGLAIIGVFWSIGRLIVEETDEFLRMLTVRQALIASALAMSAASIWGFLESAELVIHLDAYWYAVVWFSGLFVGALINRIEYGTWGSA
ncbi:MAG: hypothetical protein AAF697_04345 [Pseudomonadota bacterium]